MSLSLKRTGLACGTLTLLLSSCAPTLEIPGARLEALGALAAEINQDRLMDLVNELTNAHGAEEPMDCTPWKKAPVVTQKEICFLTRQKSGTLLQQHFESLGLTVRRQEDQVGFVSLSNVITELPGTTHPEEIVLVAAHYDAFYSGADDNTSGAAALMEMARVLSGHRFERTVRFIGFDGEELRMLGSDSYTKQLPAQEHIVATVVLDAIGYYDTRQGSQMSMPGLPSSPAGDFLAVIYNEPSSALATDVYALNRELKLTKVLPIGAAGDGISPVMEPLLRSDHNSFWLRGREALFFTDTATFRNPNYHQPTDTVDTLHPELYRKTVQLTAASIAYWAGGPL